jgi:hypothetical protein
MSIKKAAAVALVGVVVLGITAGSCDSGKKQCSRVGNVTTCQNTR